LLLDKLDSFLGYKILNFKVKKKLE